MKALKHESEREIEYISTRIMAHVDGNVTICRSVSDVTETFNGLARTANKRGLEINTNETRRFIQSLKIDTHIHSIALMGEATESARTVHIGGSDRSTNATEVKQI
jgi:hypothetical protein